MSEKATTSTTVSAPGKILLAGGYTVLESPNVGVVLAVDKKFYSTVIKHETSTIETTNKRRKIDGESAISITVHSPQFGTTWKYTAKKTDGLVVTADPENQSANPFVEKTLRITLSYLAQEHSLNHLEITILADNDFYSVTPHLKARNWDATAENLAKLPQFLPCNLSSGSLQKTGLGSSAALTTSLVGALVMAMTCTTVMDDRLRRKIHNLAQICHCHAQGKVGSGFDVSSASYGSHVYQRFPKCLLSDLLQELDKFGEAAMSPSKLQTLQHLVDENPENFKWPVVQKPLSWNTDLLQIMLADISGGSESPSMANQVLTWKASSDDTSCWTNLLKYNQRVAEISSDIVGTLEGTDKSSIAEMAQTFSKCKLEGGWKGSADENTDKVGNLLCDLRSTLLECRKNLKKMGDLAGVPVEPDEQTQLADATMELCGVVAALVPGAGGFDALVVIYVNTQEVRDSICGLWTNYKDLAVCPLAVQYAPYGEGVNYEATAPEYTAG